MSIIITKTSEMGGRRITEIIIHCSATREGVPILARDIDRWHKARGFRCIGYHYVVYLDGTIAKGRDESEMGAHCVGHNQQSIGICYVGGLDADGKPKDTRTSKQKVALSELVADLLTKYPHARVCGHNQFSNKACPCFDVEQWWYGRRDD